MNLTFSFVFLNLKNDVIDFFHHAIDRIREDTDEPVPKITLVHNVS